MTRLNPGPQQLLAKDYAIVHGLWGDIYVRGNHFGTRFADREIPRLILRAVAVPEFRRSILMHGVVEGDTWIK